MTTQTTLAQSAAFTNELKAKVRKWLSDNQLRQKDLAFRMGITPAAVSANLHPSMPMSEGFIKMLGDAVPEFADAIHDFSRIKSGTIPTPAQQTAAEVRKAKAGRIRLIRQTEKEVQAAVHRLFEELTKIVDSD